MLKGGYSSLDEAKEDIKHYVFYYNRVRPHSYNQITASFSEKPIRTADLVDHYIPTFTKSSSLNRCFIFYFTSL
ncbi:hypothetical protein INT80_10445 [Gallibacterium anatis]|uniref:Uncharacterized protein n=1 Tax=Gallibacterium anatis TaxID=750 RepID=A0A930UT36_9PAST|nr:hypothetical protein [Gallibacterium anatis]